MAALILVGSLSGATAASVAGSQRPLRVVADIGPVAALASAVLGRPVPALLEDGDDPHHFQLRPSQARLLAGADLVLWIGPELTPWLQRAVATTAGSGTSLVLADAHGITARRFRFAADAAPGGDHGGNDPHIWLDPDNALAMLDAITVRLSELDPADAAAFAANAAAAAAKLRAAAAEARTILSPYHAAPLVVAHDGYAHWAAGFDLTIAGAIADGTGAGIGAGSLAGLRREFAAGGVACVLFEPQHPEPLARQLAAEAGVASGRLDPLAATGPGSWFVTLAEAVRTCLRPK